MDILQQNRPRLEPIQEVSEQEDETEGSKIVERKDSQAQDGEETKEVTTEDESDEDEDDAVLRVMRPRRLYRFHSQGSLPQIQSTSNQQEKMENLSVSNLSDEATPPKQARLGNERRSSDEFRIKISKLRWQKRTPLQSPAQKKTHRKRHKKKSPFEESFPEWLVDLMVNIEEAKTHQLVVE